MISQIGRRLLPALVLGLVALGLLGGQRGAADDPGTDKEEEARREQQLGNMRRSAAQHTLSSAGTPRRTFKCHEAALLRFSNPVSGTKDGALYLWTDGGRPQTVLKLYTFDNKYFTHEWLSLSEGTLVAARGNEVIWTPAEPGVTLRELPGVPAPAESAAERLRQMRSLAAKFTSTYVATHLDAKPFELRLLAQPLFRYETTNDARADGAVFAFVQSTSPVGLLLLESRRTRDGHRWHYAFASLVSGPVTARWGDKEVFSAEKNYSRQDPRQPYLQLHRQPVPME
jgi:hypothetical protein